MKRSVNPDPAQCADDELGRPLRIFVDATALRVGGGGTYITEQLRALSALPAIEITAFATGDVADDLRRACGPYATIHRRPARGVVRRLLHEQFVLPFRARGQDVVYMPGGFAMFASPCPQVVTNHNAHHFGVPGRTFAKRARYPWTLRLALAIQWRVAHASVRHADAFVTLSEAFRSAVEDDLGPRRTLHVLRSAAPRLAMPSEAASATGLSGEPYALTVAHDHIHKDWDGLIHAFRKHHDLPRLVIAGAWRSGERQSQLDRQLSVSGELGRVVVLGPVADRTQIAALYHGAQCFVAHSFLEAGPLTPGEALTSGIPLVASDIPPHRETAGAHAHYYDPRDAEELAAAVRCALVTPRSVQTIAREAEWTWPDNAAKLAKILRLVAR